VTPVKNQDTPNLVRVRGRFHRSVQLTRDWSGPDDLSDYLVTPTVRELTLRIIEELSTSDGIRAWSVTGPYGTGKSAFALFLSKLLAGRLIHHPEASTFRPQIPNDLAPLVPVHIVGERGSLRRSLLGALEQALAPSALAVAQDIRSALVQDVVDDATVVSLFERAGTAVLAEGRGGLLILLDEFGKFLEHLATHSDGEDLLIMQHLAEAAARSSVPMILVTILHSGFTAYLNSDDEVQQAEWQKVQGRFTDVAFQEPPEQLLRLVGAALDARFTPDLTTRYEQYLSHTLNDRALAESKERMALRQLLPACVPFDPLTALLLWPLFRSKLAQNERSLFSFLTSQEPFGFQDFLGGVDWEAEELPLYRLDQLYDYVSASLGPGAYRGNLGRRWAEVDEAINRVGATAPALTKAVLKALGLLWIYGAPVGLRASESALKLAFGGNPEVPQALEILRQSKIIVYRRFEDAYGLWEGSDVDLEEHHEQARQQLARGRLAERLSKQVDLRPLVARAHYIKTGTLRYFTVSVLEGSETALKELFAKGDQAEAADGRIAFVLTPDEHTRKALLDLATGLSRDTALTILAFPKPVAGLERALENLESWRFVERNTPELHGDKAARSELYANLQAAQRQLDVVAGGVLGLRGHRFLPESSEWVQGGRRHMLDGARHFQQWLSDLCDTVFHSAPPLKNELLNRRKLSSAAKAGLNKLVQAMAANERVERFGIEGTPAEVSMYEALLREGGFHRTVGGWRIGGPINPNWQPVWRVVEAFLASTRAGRRPVTELYAQLKAPPYGMRDGPLPLLLVTALSAKRDEVAIYRQGLYQPSLNEQLLYELTRLPESFELQQFVFDAESHETLEAMQGVMLELGVAPAVASDHKSLLLELAKPLVVSVFRLPDYAKKTQRLEPTEAVALRNLILNAVDPHELMLVRLPELLNIPVEAENRTTRLAQRLRDSLVALYQAYPRLLDGIEAQVKDVFDLIAESQEGIAAELRARAEPLTGLATEVTLKRFISEATRLSGRDWREVIGRVVMDGKAPSIWTDVEFVDFQVRLLRLHSDFVRLEELALEKRKSGANQVIRVGVLRSSLEEVRESISLTKARLVQVEDLLEKVRDVLAAYDGGDGRAVRLAALAQAVLKEVEEEA